MDLRPEPSTRLQLVFNLVFSLSSMKSSVPLQLVVRLVFEESSLESSVGLQLIFTPVFGRVFTKNQTSRLYLMPRYIVLLTRTGGVCYPNVRLAPGQSSLSFGPNCGIEFGRHLFFLFKK